MKRLVRAAPKHKTLPHLRYAHRSLFPFSPAFSSDLASAPQLSTFLVSIASRNNFPTAAGLASSASGFAAALVASLAALYELPAIPPSFPACPQGSGSACRSLFCGFVAWEMGSAPDGSDSLAIEVVPREHWPDIHALLCRLGRGTHHPPRVCSALSKHVIRFSIALLT
jgi:hypothetical protein